TTAPAASASSVATKNAKVESEDTDSKPRQAAGETVSVSSENKPASAVKAPAGGATTAAKHPVVKSKPDSTKTAALAPPTESKPTRDGQRSLTRTLGLKISRI